jgi:hypothetical protein
MLDNQLLSTKVYAPRRLECGASPAELRGVSREERAFLATSGRVRVAARGSDKGKSYRCEWRHKSRFSRDLDLGLALAIK